MQWLEPVCKSNTGYSNLCSFNLNWKKRCISHHNPINAHTYTSLNGGRSHNSKVGAWRMPWLVKGRASISACVAFRFVLLVYVVVRRHWEIAGVIWILFQAEMHCHKARCSLSPHRNRNERAFLFWHSSDKVINEPWLVIEWKVCVWVCLILKASCHWQIHCVNLLFLISLKKLLHGELFLTA